LADEPGRGGDGIAPSRPRRVNALLSSGLNSPRGLRFGAGGFLYVAEGGSGGIARIHPNGSWEVVADLSAFRQAHPIAHPERERDVGDQRCRVFL